MSAALHRPMTREEFLDWDGHEDGRYEFDGFQPVAMNGGLLGHNTITLNILGHLRDRLAGSPCRRFGLDAGIATTGSRVRYPDAVVTCTPSRANDKLLPNPVVVFEVVSPGSIRTDRVTKLNEYADVPTILRYVVVDSQDAAISVFSREAGEQAFRASGVLMGDMLPLPEIGIELPVADIYDGVLPAPDDGPRGTPAVPPA